MPLQSASKENNSSLQNVPFCHFLPFDMTKMPRGDTFAAQAVSDICSQFSGRTHRFSMGSNTTDFSRSNNYKILAMSTRNVLEKRNLAFIIWAFRNLKQRRKLKEKVS